MAAKKRKEDSERHVFNEKWGEKYFFAKADNNTANCLICNESNNLRRHCMKQSTYLNILNFRIATH